MFRIAIRNIRTHKTRLLMTMLAVVLGVAFVAGTLVFTDTVSQGFQNQSATDLAGVDVAIRPTPTANDDGRPAGLTDALVDRVRAVPGVTSARGEVSGAAYVLDGAGKIIGKHNLGAAFTPGSVAQGRAPRAADEIALDAATAAKAGVGVGGSVRIVIDGPIRTERVVGIVTSTDPAVSAGATLAVFDAATAQRLLNVPGQYTQIVVTATPGTDDQRLVRTIAPLLGPDAQAVTAATVIADERAANASDTRTLGDVFLAFALIALFVGIFLIANTFTMLIAQRTRELALLRALGATRRQVNRSIQFEAFGVGLLSSAIGLVLGILVAIGLRVGLNGLVDAGLPCGAPVVTPSTVLIALLVGTAVTMVAAWLPGLRAGRIAPVAAMSSVDATPTPASLRTRNIIGFLVAAASLGVVALGITNGGTSGAYAVGGGGGGLVIALIILTPFLSRPLLGLLGRPLTRWFGVAGKLATGNARRNPRRTASTTAALMLGLVLITALTVISASFAQALAQQTTGALRAQYTISSVNGAPLDPSIERTVAAVPGVTIAAPVRTAPVAAIGTATNEMVAALDPTQIDQVLAPKLVAGGVGGLESGLLVSQNVADTLGHPGIGAVVPVTFADGKRESLRLTGIYRTNPVLTDGLVSLDTLARHTVAVRDDNILVSADSAAADRVRAALAGNPLLRVEDHTDLEHDVSSTFDLLLNLVYGLLAMALVVSVLGVVNTMAMSVFERTREIGLLRAIGLPRNGIRLMVRLESVIISLFGAALGIGVGVFLAWALGSIFGRSNLLRDAYQLVIPWDRILLFLAVAGIVGVLSAVWPARHAAKLNVIQAVTTD